MTDVATTIPRGPARADERALAPDLARGVMLLMIVLANTPWYLYGRTAGLSTIHPEGGTVADQVTQLLIMTFIDSRVYPMFAFLFGYGMVQLYTRQVASGLSAKAARRLLQKRNLWLLIFGAVHAALLWFGDVLGAYGLAGLIMVAIFFKRKDQTLLVWFAALAGFLLSGIIVALAAAPFAARAPASAATESFLASVADIAGIESYPASIVARLAFWVFLVLFQGVLTLVVPAVLLGCVLGGPAADPRGARPTPAAAPPGRRRRSVGRMGVRPAARARPPRTAGDPAAAVLGVLGDAVGQRAARRAGLRGPVRPARPSDGNPPDGARPAHSSASPRSGSDLCPATWRSPSYVLRCSRRGVSDWVAGSAARRWRCSRSASGSSPWSWRTRRNGPGSVVRPRCCCAVWSTGRDPHAEHQVGGRGDRERGTEQV